MKQLVQMDESLLVDISDALSERDRVRFTVHTRTKLAQFAKPVMSVVRQHEEFIWLHDCLEDNDQYAGYIIPPAPPKPDFDASREKLQRLGDGEGSMSKAEFAKMKQELEAEYLAIFKKTVAMHEIFLQRLAAHQKFREDHNFKIFLEYENELAVRGKSKKEKLAGSIQNIGKSLTDFVITTSQVAATTSASGSINRHLSMAKQHLGRATETTNNTNQNGNSDITRSVTTGNLSRLPEQDAAPVAATSTTTERRASEGNANGSLASGNDDVDEQYFEKERLFLALYHNSIRETAIQADRVSQARKNVADSYLQVSQQLVRLASIEVVPITAQTKDSPQSIACPLPSLSLPSADTLALGNGNLASSTTASPPDTPATSSKSADPESSSTSRRLELTNDERELSDGFDEDLEGPSTSGVGSSTSTSTSAKLARQPSDKVSDKSTSNSNLKRPIKPKGVGCANDHTSEGLKQLLLNVSDCLEAARKIETRMASDEDLKLTDTFLYYKRDTVAAQDLLMRRLRFMAEYEQASKNLEKARQKGRTQMQYADVIQRQAKENFISISKLAKRELADYKQRRVASFRKAFGEIVELELKHLRSQTQLIANCLEVCRGLAPSG